MQGRLEHSVDEQGRLFIDRDPELFAVLLQFMRASTTPPQNDIRAHRESLLEECRFFGVDSARIRGHISNSDLSPQDRLIKKQEYEARALPEAHPDILLDVFAQDASPVEPTDLGLHIFRRGGRRPVMKCNDYTSFCARFDRVTGGLAKEIKKVSGIVFAGGSVIGTLTEGTIGDIDIFLTCALEQARFVIERIYSAVQKIDNGSSRKILLTRSRHAVTIHRVRSDGKMAALPVQVIRHV